jgi:hypothetical protein
MTPMTKSAWKTKPLPVQRINLGYERFLLDADSEKLLNGFRPCDMDDRWFVYSEDGWVYFVRSWTGHHIFGLKLHPTPAGGAKIVESWANDDPREYNSPSDEENRRSIDGLLFNLFNIGVEA